MSSKYSLLIALALAALGASAQIAVENFDYDPGANLEDLGAAGGGWDGAWNVVRGNGDNDGTIVAGGINAPELAQTTGGNHLRLEHDGMGGTRFWRRLATPRGDVAGQVTYVSFFMGTEFEGDAGPNGSVNFLGLANADAFGASGPGGQIGFVGRQFAQENLGLVRVPTNARIDDDNSAREVTFVVMALYGSGDDGADHVAVWFNPSPAEMMLDSANADIVRRDLTFNDGFNAIGGKIEGGGTINGVIDEVRVGESYEDVQPEGLTPGASNNATTLLNDDLSADQLVYLGFSGSYTATQVSDGEIGIVGNGGGQAFENLVFQLTDEDGEPTQVNLGETNRVFIRAKATSAVQLRADADHAAEARHAAR